VKSMTFSTRLVDRIPRVEGVKTFRFERIKQYVFTAGQWFVLTIPEGDGYLTKHFTHSSSPTEGYLDFTTRLTGSQYKNALDALPVGTEVEIEGPFGEFTLRGEAKRVAFITGGIGVTPIRSILRLMADTGDHREVALLYGNKDYDSIAFRLELESFSAQLPNLKVAHVLSDPQPDWGRPPRLHPERDPGRRTWQRRRVDVLRQRPAGHGCSDDGTLDRTRREPSGDGAGELRGVLIERLLDRGPGGAGPARRLSGCYVGFRRSRGCSAMCVASIILRNVGPAGLPLPVRAVTPPSPRAARPRSSQQGEPR